MKISCQVVLALCVIQQTTAFFIQAPKVITFGYLRSTNGDGTSEAYASAFSTNTASPASPQYGTALKVTDKPNDPKESTTADMKVAKNIWDTTVPMIIQGGSLRTWSEATGLVERVQVVMKTEGRPMNANVELWHGPENTPLKMSIYSENGSKRPFSAVIETPDGQNTIAIRNTGSMEFPVATWLDDEVENVAKSLYEMGTLKTMQGGAILTYPFDPSVASVQILLKTSGRPLNAKIELLQGPNNDKQVIEIYTEDGDLRPFFAVIETPGSGNVVRIVNTASVEFPITACVQSYLVDREGDDSTNQGWDNGGSTTFLPFTRQ